MDAVWYVQIKRSENVYLANASRDQEETSDATSLSLVARFSCKIIEILEYTVRLEKYTVFTFIYL